MQSMGKKYLFTRSETSPFCDYFSAALQNAAKSHRSDSFRKRIKCFIAADLR